ncbi:MAG TPA: TraR/DksA C4-type zinc finger protein [Candidatus Dormibacteraeota bacterium]
MAELSLDLDSARRELEAHLTRVNHELSELEKVRESAREGKDETAGYGNGVGEAAVETSAAERDRALIENLEHVQHQVQYALTRLDEGTYGVCETCGQAIPRERLEALPFAGQCVACKSKDQH